MTIPARFTHNAFPTARLDDCIRFYAECAGMRAVKQRGEPGERVVWLAPATADAPIFVLVESAAQRPPASEPLLRHLGFELPTRDAVDALHARLAAAGLDPTAPEFVDDVVGYIFLVRDPDGRVVEFNHGQDVSPANWD